MKKLAFTLSEILLTLAIVGTVSAMTIPSINYSVQEKKLQAQAKKAYATLQGAVLMKYSLTGRVPSGGLLNSLLSEPSALKVMSHSGAVDEGVVTDAAMAQLTDGSVIYVDGNTVYVDINGIMAPNVSSVVAGQTSANGVATASLLETISSAVTNRTINTNTSSLRDIVVFNVNNLDVVPDLNSYWTRRYIAEIQAGGGGS